MHVHCVRSDIVIMHQCVCTCRTKSQEFNCHHQLLVGGGGHVTGRQGLLPGQLSGHDRIVVPPMCPVPDELRGDDQAKCVYLQPQSKRQRLLQVCSKGETFPSEQELESVQDTYALIYGEEVSFTINVHIQCTCMCIHVHSHRHTLM